MLRRALILMWPLLLMVSLGNSCDDTRQSGNSDKSDPISITPKAVVSLTVGILKLGVTVDRNGHWTHSLGLVSPGFNLGPVGIQVGIQSAIETVQGKTSYLIVLRQNSVGNVERFEYNIGEPFDLTFNSHEHVQEIMKRDDNIIVVVNNPRPANVEPVTRASIDRLSVPEEERLGGLPYNSGAKLALRIDVSGSGNDLQLRPSRAAAYHGAFRLTGSGSVSTVQIPTYGLVILRVTGSHNLIFIPRWARILYDDEGLENKMLADLAFNPQTYRRPPLFRVPSVWWTPQRRPTVRIGGQRPRPFGKSFVQWPHGHHFPWPRRH